jgi:hypothetical protein
MFGLVTKKSHDYVLLKLCDSQRDCNQLRESNDRLLEIIKELETSLVEKKVSEVEMEVKTMVRGDFPKKYWAYRKANPECKLTMAEYRDQIYNKEKVVVDGTQKA